MNQYIITEEKLAEIESTPNEDTKDWLRIFYGLCDGVRSHHYQSERDTVLELLEDLRKYANGEYKEADLSDNEHDLRIHLEYENRIWGIMKELRPAGR